MCIRDRDAPDIGAETKERVRLIAQQIGYQPNRAGVRLRTGKTNVIALVLSVDEELMGFTSQMVFGITEVLATTQYHLVVTPHTHAKDSMVPIRYILETGSADGVIISKIEPNDPRVRFMTERKMPFVTHGPVSYTHLDVYKRQIIIMIKAGDPVDQQMEILKPHLSNGDIMIDAGNANFRDTIRRFDNLKDSGLTFIGMGVSGGEEGARHGPSIMVGGTEDSWKRVEKVLTSISAKYNDCLLYTSRCV